MNARWLQARQTRFTAYVTLYVVIVIAILGLLNWLAQRYDKSFDTTANKRFTLSEQTQKVVSGLSQPVRITYFDRSENFGQARDLLDRYGAISNRLTVDYVDPDRNPNLAREAGIRNEGAIVVRAGNRREEAKSLTEQDITSTLVRVLKGGARNVCAVQGSGEHSLADTGRQSYSGFKDLMERNNYTTRTISLLEKPEVPTDCTILLIAGPRFNYVQPVVDAIRSYIEGGGDALIMLDPPLQFGEQPIAANELLVKQLGAWGITPQPTLVFDTSGIGQVFGLSAAVPLVSSYGRHPIVDTMQGVATAFPLARSLEVGNATQLFSTGENSFASTNMRSAEADPNTGKPGPFTLGAAAAVGEKGRIVVTGSSAWVANNILGFNGNSDLAMNMLNWLSSDEDLISIRPKDPENRMLQMTGRDVNLLFYTSIIMIPLSVAAIGISVWWKRR